MAGKSGRPWRRRIALGGVVVALLVSSGCAGPYQYDEGTGVHDATTAEVSGNWEGAEETRLTLRRDGTALLQRLDGQDFDFDDGWRLSGTGTWELTDDADGQDVRLTLTHQTRVERRDTGTTTGAAAPARPPATYSWRFSVRRDPREALELFFFFGDPDIGNTYVMTRAKPS
ncbi:hypothetical protein AB0A69_04750 [Streptomyces sp. NPDC045431]|uniref:hypothetical protein n=1 Tax=Streptomyces sp. NPDC045431 TaxID=3155613 RepID=UPI0033D4BD73